MLAGWHAGAIFLSGPRPASARGKPEPADFVAKNLVGDSVAPAVVRYDYGTTRFRLNGLSFQMKTERTTRLWILKKAGYDYATVEMPLYHREANEEKITGLKDFTYNEVGDKIEKVKLDGTNMVSEDRTQACAGAQVYAARRARGGRYRVFVLGGIRFSV